MLPGVLAAAAPRCRGRAAGSSGWPFGRNSTAATVMRSPRLASMPAADPTRRSTSFSCLSIASGVGALAQRRQQPLAVDHHGDGQALDLVAFADGRDGLGAHLVVGELLAALVLLLRLVAARRCAACSAGMFCSTPTAVPVALLFCELPVSLTTRTERSTLRFGIEVGLVGLPLVGVEPRGDADLEVVEAEIGRQRLADVVLQLLGRWSSPGSASWPAWRWRYRRRRQGWCRRCSDRHLVDGHARDRGGDQMADGLRAEESRRPTRCG